MILTLRVIHILFGVFWVGAALVTAAFLIPTIRAVGPAGGPVMQHITQVRKLPRYIMGAGFLTILSGIGLYSKASGGFTNAWMRSGPGTTFGIGGALALIALSIGLFGAMPMAKRAGALAGTIAASGGPPSTEQAAEMKRLQQRAGSLSALGSSLLVLATGAMAVARYIP